MNKVQYRPGLCFKCKRKLSFFTAPVEKTLIHLLYCVCDKCKLVTFCDLREDGEEYKIEELEIDFNKMMQEPQGETLNII